MRQSINNWKLQEICLGEGLSRKRRLLSRFRLSSLLVFWNDWKIFYANSRKEGKQQESRFGDSYCPNDLEYWSHLKLRYEKYGQVHQSKAQLAKYWESMTLKFYVINHRTASAKQLKHNLDVLRTEYRDYMQNLLEETGNDTSNPTELPAHWDKLFAYLGDKKGTARPNSKCRSYSKGIKRI